MTRTLLPALLLLAAAACGGQAAPDDGAGEAHDVSGDAPVTQAAPPATSGATGDAPAAPADVAADVRPAVRYFALSPG